ncbi:MAG: HAD family phosphatase [Micropepsaceae bacterium]
MKPVARDGHLPPIIFDFDGVVVDSEILASRIFAEYLSLSGAPMTEADIAANFTGMRLVDSMNAIEARHGKALPQDFYDGLHAYGRTIFSEHLRIVEGADAFIRKCANRKIAIASSSDLQHISHSLDLVGLSHHFAGRCFSAARLAHGKPHPDIYLIAADAIGAPPAACIAIEDSERGVTAAVRAGMYTIGLTAASHCHAGTISALREAGAHYVANSYFDIERHLEIQRGE